MARAVERTRARRGGANRIWWEALPQDELLDVRLCDLGLSVEGTALEARVERLHEELRLAGLVPRPYVWLASDFFTPDGLTGFAVPFYLAHRRLVRLEHAMMFEAEGATHADCMRLLRHEAGHAIDNAFRLRRRARFRRVFGPAGTPYDDVYTPDPRSRDFVLNLPQWYSQSHPVEDFAETFAVCLKPGSRWRSEYRDWPALEKLHYVDELLGDLRGVVPPVRTRRREETLPALKVTLREHYEEKRARYCMDLPSVHDSTLRKLFEGAHGSRHGTAAAFLRRSRTELRRRVCAMTDQHPYVIDQLLNELVPRCRQLGLQLSRSPRETFVDTAIVLTAATIHTVSGRSSTYSR